MLYYSILLYDLILYYVISSSPRKVEEFQSTLAAMRAIGFHVHEAWRLAARGA